MKHFASTISLPVHSAFGSLSRDLGDDIQAFALEQILGRIDGYTDMDNLKWEPRECILPVCGECDLIQSPFLVSPTISLAFVGYRISQTKSIASETVEHFHGSQPLGCGDTRTLRFFARRKIKGFLSYPPVLGLERWLSQSPDGPLVAVDLSDDFLVPEGAVKVSHDVSSGNTHPQFVRSRTVELLEVYQQAALVITSQLQAAYACMAFGTPFHFVKSDSKTLPDYVFKQSGLASAQAGQFIPEERRLAMVTKARSDLRDAISLARAKGRGSSQKANSVN